VRNARSRPASRAASGARERVQETHATAENRFSPRTGTLGPLQGRRQRRAESFEQTRSDTSATARKGDHEGGVMRQKPAKNDSDEMALSRFTLGLPLERDKAISRNYDTLGSCRWAGRASTLHLDGARRSQDSGRSLLLGRVCYNQALCQRRTNEPFPYLPQPSLPALASSLRCQNQAIKLTSNRISTPSTGVRARSLAPASSVAPLTALAGQCALHHFFERG
jgi:hypothetical protein